MKCPALINKNFEGNDAPLFPRGGLAFKIFNPNSLPNKGKPTHRLFLATFLGNGISATETHEHGDAAA